MKKTLLLFALALAAYCQGPLGGGRKPGGSGSGSSGDPPASVTQTLYSLGTCAGTKAVDYNNSTTQTMTLSGNCAVTMVQPPAGKSVLVRVGITQAASGGPFTASFTGAKWPGGIAPVMSAGASRVDWYACLLDGTNAFCTAAQEFQ